MLNNNSNYNEKLEKINALKEQFNVENIYSWSKLDTFNTDKWLYYLKYVAKVPADNKTGAYAIMGSLIHSQLQKFYEENITNQEMIDNFNNGYDEFILKGYRFDKTDDKRNDKIAEKYIYCCNHFLKNHQKIKGKVICEPFVPLIIQNNKGENKIIQGYIDMLNYDGEYINIIDYKTSTIYTKQAQEELSGQLIIYGLAVHKALDIPIDKIRLYWNFVKYVSVDYLQMNGTWKTRNIERNVIGESLSTTIRSWAKKIGYSEEEIGQMIFNCVNENSIDSLPDNIKDKFVIRDCLVEIKFNQEKADELIQKILATIEEIEKLEFEYAITQNEMLFWQEVTKADEYRLANLCDYSSKYHLPYKKYLEEKEKLQRTMSTIKFDDLADLLN